MKIDELLDEAMRNRLEAFGDLRYEERIHPVPRMGDDFGTYVNDNRQQVKHGGGFDQLRYGWAGTAIQVADVDPFTGKGERVVFSLKALSSTAELRSELSISAAASFSSGAFGASGRVDLFQKTRASSYRNYVLITVTVTYEARGLSEFEFKNDAVRKLYAENAQAFYNRYGTEFVAAIIDGGEFIALLEIEASSLVEYEAQKAVLRANSITTSVSAEFSSRMESIREFRQVEVSMSRVGATGDLPSLDPDSLIAYSVGFPSLVRQTANPATLFFTTLSYKKAGDGEPIDFSSPLNKLNRAVELLERAQTQWRDWSLVETRSNLFEETDVSLAPVYKAELSNFLRGLADYVDLLRNRPFEAEEVPTLIERSVPRLKSGARVRLTISAVGMVLGIRIPYSGEDGQRIGETGKYTPIGQVNIAFSEPIPGLSLRYWVHLSGVGDRGPFGPGQTTPNIRHEGIRIELTGPLKPFYDLTYCAHIESIGDMWASDGQYAGTTGSNLRMESMIVQLGSKPKVLGFESQ